MGWVSSGTPEKCPETERLSEKNWNMSEVLEKLIIIFIFLQKIMVPNTFVKFLLFKNMS